jgi:hypothetical protein
MGSDTGPQGLGKIPQSHALEEARTDSLAEFMSRDPEGFTRQDRGRMVLVLREQRARWEATETQQKPKKISGKTGALASSTTANADDLGL